MNNLSGKDIRGYQLRDQIGVGGYGAVYRAYQPIIRREVAIKVILPEYASQPEFIRRFETEAQVVARLEHMHIVPLYDYWRDPEGAYLVMRYLRGGSVQQALARHGTWDVPQIIRLLDQITAALAVAHRNGVIHRDIKPGNILLDDDGNAFLSDFGIAKDLRKSAKVLPEEGHLGSPAYISPEQVLLEPLTPRVDIYSLGVVLFELLTGQRPFDAATDTTVLRQHVIQILPSVHDVRADLPAILDIVVQRATAKHPEDRYSNVLQLAADFRSVAGFTSIAAIPSKPQLDADTLATPIPPSDTFIVDANTLDVGPRDKGTVDLHIVAPVETRNPYKGLRAFDEADTADFFGRDALVMRLLMHLNTARFLAVIGPSGSGKSSAVRAGLIPALRRKAIISSDEWFVTVMTPGTQPLENLQDALLRVAVRMPDQSDEPLEHDSDWLQSALKYILPEDSDQLVLVIDQFEELFTLVTDEAARIQFMDMLAAAVNAPDSALRLVITLRADFYDRPLLHPMFGDMLRQHTEVVLPLAPDELRETIVTPAKRVGLQLEAALVDAIISDVHTQPGALPLLQYALTELFEQREGKMLTLEAYRNIGGVSGALARRADTLYEQLDPAGQNAARQLFLRLIALGPNGEDTRRRLVQAELQSLGGDVMQETITTFAQHRLLTFDRDPFTRAPTVEVAHEALIRRWDRLVRWLEDSRAALQVQRRMAQEVAEWQLAERASGFLATGSRLAQYENLNQEASIALTQDEQAYLQASIQRRKQAENWRWAGIIALIVFSIVALGLALLASDRERRADQQASVARSRELAVRSLTNRDDQLDLALLLSLHALDEADTFEARNSLLTALESQPNLISFLHGHSDSVRAVAFDPQGKWLASAGRDNSIILWDVGTHQMVGAPLSGHDDWINTLAFSPDGHTLASAGEDSTIRLWDVETGEAIGEPLTGHDGSVWSVRFSDDGQKLASAGEDGTIRLWDVETGESIGQALTGHSDIVFSLDFNADQLVSGSADGTIRLWDVETGAAIGQPLSGHSDWVLSVTFSPDGQMIASGGADNTVRLWDAQTGSVVTQLNDYSDWVRSVTFSPDGNSVVSGSADRNIHLYDLQTSQNRMLGQHNEAVWSTAFSADGSMIASGGIDHEVRLWDVTGQTGLSQLFAQQTEAVPSLALAGNVLASANGDPNGDGLDHSILLWDVSTGEQLHRLEGHTKAVMAIAFSPDGSRLVSASVDQTLMLWYVDSGTGLTAPLTGHSDAIMAVAFSPDGTRIASAGFDRTIRLWDAETGASIGEPLSAHSDAVLSLAFSPDGQRLVSGSFDNTIRQWDAETGASIGEPLSAHSDAVTGLAFSPDGQQMASTSRDGRVLLWDMSANPPTARALSGHQNWVLAAAFHPTEHLLATGSRDNTIILWDLLTLQPLGQPLQAHTNWVSALVFSPDGHTLFSGSHDMSIRQWQTRLSDWRRLACSIANRDLSVPEQTALFGETARSSCAENSSET